MPAQNILSLDALSAVAESQRGEGRSVVLCHGMFDLIHLGHVRHLQKAKLEGDVLMVTVTADNFSRKGPGRPVFTDILRAEALVALACVDYVAVNHADTAVSAIQTIKPNVYAKGSDYRDPEDDISGKIIDEQQAVEAHGGRIYFTDELTFSSSNILNRHFGIFPEDTSRYLQDRRGEHNFDDISRELEKLANCKTLVIGEAIIDRYTFVSPLGQSGKSSALCVRHQYSEDYAGGSMAVANHIAAFVNDITLLTALGGKGAQGVDDSEFIGNNLHKNVTPHLIRFNQAQTIVKQRFVDSDNLAKLFEVYYFEEEPQVSDPEEEEVCAWLQANLQRFDAVIVPDYGNGMITPRMVEKICAPGPFLAVNTQVNSGNRGYHVVTRYPRANFICLNEPELWLASHNRHDPTEKLARQIMAKLGAEYMAVTQGVKGLLAIDKKSAEPHHVPALASKVVDRVGAGDAFLALASICLASGLPPKLASFVGAAAAALDVQFVGNRRTVEREALLQYISVLLK
jgi:rfaE bifunctional protein kinase chain/domain/rfaE bifunctional protein nucleotidyltransferase chain/domain